MSVENWRIEQDARDYLTNRDKRIATEERRPVIRKAGDLVGPGIGASATVITNFNDVLATFNGYYSAEPTAASAPNMDEPFTGFVVSDATLGGTQVFTGMVSGNTWRRIFTRNPADPETLGFGSWVPESAVASLCRLNDWPLPLSASQYALADLRDAQVRGNRVLYAAPGTIQVTADGWYEVGGQCRFDSGGTRVNLRICNGADPAADILVDREGNGVSITPSIGGTELVYLLADTYVRMFVASSTAGSTSAKSLWVREA